MGTLLIDRKDVELRRDGDRLLVFEQGTRTGSVPVSHLRRIVIQNRAVLDTAILGVLVEHGVDLVVINPRRPQATARLTGSSHNDAGRRLTQYRYSLDNEWRQRWSMLLVWRKIKAQRLFLHRALASRPDLRHTLVKAIRNLDQRIDVLREESSPLRDRVCGIEGAAAAAYFKALTHLFPPSLEFTDRNRRPPRDPVNACLSLAYTLLHADAVLALQVAGLDPMLGFYHDVAFGRESLACDVIEPLRPRVDEWIWTLFRERALRSEDFSVTNGACLLNKAGRKTFYTSWEICAQPLRRALRRGASLLAKRFAEEAENEDNPTSV